MSSAGELSTKEQSELFFRHFQNEVAVLKEKMDGVIKLSTTEEQIDALDTAKAGVQQLSQEVADASVYVPAHDQRTYSEGIKSLKEQVEKTQNAAAPKPKFAFKKKKMTTQKYGDHPLSRTSTSTASSDSSIATIVTPAEEVDTSVDDGPYDLQLREAAGPRIRKPSFTQAESVSLNNHSYMHIVLPASATHAMTTGKVKHIKHCIVDMSNPERKRGTAFASFTLKDIRESLIITSDVAGPVHITGIEDSVLVTSCRQLRLHECKNVNVYLQCASRPIVEDCSKVQFAPLPEFYKTEENKPATDRWDQVDDFKWLKAGPSPNWSIMPAKDRVGERTWAEYVKGSHEVGLEEILKAVDRPVTRYAK